MRQRPVDSIENPNGRDLWVERMVAHSRNLAGVRPSVECWHSRPPLARPRSARVRAADESFHNNEVLHLQQRIEEIHQPQRRSRTTQSTNPGSRQRCVPRQPLASDCRSSLPPQSRRAAAPAARRDTDTARLHYPNPPRARAVPSS